MELQYNVLLMAETIGDRVKEFRVKRGFTQEQLAKKINTTQTTIANLERGRNKKTTFLPDIARVLNVDVTYLAYGSGGVIPVPQMTFVSTHQVPLITMAQTAEWWSEDGKTVEAEEWLTPPSNASPRTFAVRVEGGSMLAPHPQGGYYPEGIILYVDPDHPGPYVGRRIIALYNGEATFKELSQDGSQLYLRPLNPQYPTIPVDASDFKVIGVVVSTYQPE